MENKRGLMRALEQQLTQDIDHDGEGDERQCADRDDGVDGLVGAMLAERVKDCCEETHGDEYNAQWGREGRGGGLFKEEEVEGGKIARIIIFTVIRWAGPAPWFLRRFQVF